MADKDTINKLINSAYDMRIDLLKLCYNAGILHIGGDLSITDIITCLFQYVMKFDPNNVKWEGRDRFLLSKGHCAATVYMAQAHAGFFDKEELLNTYMGIDSRFGMHPCANALDTLEISTGSLGHGLPIGVGMALAAKMDGKKHRVFVVIGDGESQEGSVWEGLMAGANYKLGNLVLTIDRNGLSMDGSTEEYMMLEPFADKLKAFNWKVVEVDGHNMEQLCDAYDQLPPVDSDVPTLVLAHTIKGKGIDFMENNPLWHAGTIKDEETLNSCLQQIEDARERQLGGTR